MILALAAVTTALKTIAGTAVPTAVIIDGVAVDEGQAPLEIYIGGAPDDSLEVPSSTAVIEWAAIGRVFDEQGAIPCVVAAWSGDIDFAALRLIALNALSAILTAIATDPSLNDTCVWVKAAPTVSVTQTLDSRGARVLIEFTITYQARP